MSAAIETRIAILDERTANQIAAGEVIERPSSVVKELVENSIDAGATRILVELEEGGKKLVRVTDNGCGMNRQDAVLSLQRHATSKIRTVEDLSAIKTLGFRGEALPSIASVSLMEMVTHSSDEPSGVRLRVEAGTIIDLEQVGAPVGTCVSVRDLFFNTPARLKFLKSSQTELHHIIDLVGRFALAHHKISFRVMHGGRELLFTPASTSLLNSLVAVLGRDIARELIPICFETSALKVRGYISKPSLTRPNRAQQHFFVNGRPIRSKTIAHAADESFRGLLTPARFPVVVIFVDIDPALVDVNVHPAKSEVKFSRQDEVHSAVYKAVREALSASAAVPSISSSIAQRVPHAEREKHTRSSEARPGLHVGEGRLIQPADDVTVLHDAFLARSGLTPDSEDPFVWESEEKQAAEEAADSTGAQWDPGIESAQSVIESAVAAGEERSQFGEVAELVSGGPISFTGIRVIGQLRNTYILAESESGLLIIDQHVAHERVLFDRMSLAREKETLEMQRLVVPATISLGRRESLLVNQKLSDFKRAGFELEWFGKDSFVVRAIPAELAHKDFVQVIRDMIDELTQLTVARRLLVKQEQVLTAASCRMAIKAGDKLMADEMSRLVEDLLRSRNPFMCPHGRPIIVMVSEAELLKRFRR